MTEVKYPNITVELTGHDGNAYSILARVKRAMRLYGLSDEEIAKFRAEAMSGNYDNLLQTCMRWVNVE